jgi:radical SAM/Cys-rich protein
MTTLATLQRKGDNLSVAKNQIDILSKGDFVSFEEKLNETSLFPLKPISMDVFQINMGKMCNQVCKHCHVDAGPDRKEIMTKETLQQCLDVIKSNPVKTVDLTGGAPEMNPNFRWFVEQIRATSDEITIIVRCNLTIILANKKYNDLPDFFKKNKIEVVSSLPYFASRRTDAQRGDGVFEKSIKALQLLNEIGYGKEEGYNLNLVYNPTGTFLPSSQEGLEKEFKMQLSSKYDISFNHLFAITNVPISRYLEFLVRGNKYEDYMTALIEAYNPTAAENVMCRTMISIGWDGYLYDCDFNQMLELGIKETPHITNFNLKKFLSRKIQVNRHCFGCTAGAGSSCGGEVV